MKVANNLDLTRHELQNFVFQNLAAAPAAPINGMVYYDTVLNSFRRYENGAWADYGNQLTAADILTLLLTNPDVNVLTDAEKTKFDNIQENATDDQTGAEIKAAYEAEANTNAFTDAEKTKLSGIEGSKFLGTFASEAALETAFPAAAATAGQYADVDAGVGVDVARYVLDDDDNAWKPSTGSISGETSASIKTKYEANADTNAYNDVDKAKVDSIAGKFAGDITGNGALTNFPVAHGLNTTDVTVNVWEVSSNELILVDVVRTDVNNISVNFGTAPVNAKVYRVVVMG